MSPTRLILRVFAFVVAFVAFRLLLLLLLGTCWADSAVRRGNRECRPV